MRNPIEANLKKANRMCILSILCLVTGILECLYGLGTEGTEGTGILIQGIFLLWCCMALMIIYVNGARYGKRSVKEHKKRGISYEGLITDMNFCMPNLPKSRICAGQMAICFMKRGIILDYQSIVWIYVKKMSLAGIAAVDEEFVIATITGEQYTVKVDKQEFMYMLNANVSKFPPYLMMGYSAQQSDRYWAIVRNYKNQILQVGSPQQPYVQPKQEQPAQEQPGQSVNGKMSWIMRVLDVLCFVGAFVAAFILPLWGKLLAGIVLVILGKILEYFAKNK